MIAYVVMTRVFDDDGHIDIVDKVFIDDPDSAKAYANKDKLTNYRYVEARIVE